MFYVSNILQKKAALGTVWIAAHHDVSKKLTKDQIARTDIVQSADQIENPALIDPDHGEKGFALRLSSHLLLGLSKIYTRKVQNLFNECNDALYRITSAFRPSNVDMQQPTNARAYMRSITHEDHGATNMDMYDVLDLNMNNIALWTTDNGASQTSMQDITLPDTQASQAPQSQAAAAPWDEEDPLFFGNGGSMEMDGANPLDIDYEPLDPEAPRADEEDPELRRDSDGSILQPIAGAEVLGRGLSEIGADADLIPDFEMEEPLAARPSEAHPASLPPTPIISRESEDGGLTSFATPELEINQRAKAARRRGTKRPQLDAAIELHKEVTRAWVMDPESVLDLVRAPRALPRTRRATEFQDALEGGRGMAEAIMRQPMSNFLGSRLRHLIAESATEGAAQRSTKKARQEAQKNVEESRAEPEPEPEVLPEIDYDPTAMEAEDHSMLGESQGAMETAEADVEGGRGSGGGGIFEDYADNSVDNVEDGGEGLDDADSAGPGAVEHQERTKKVIKMLQKSFNDARRRKKSATEPLHFASMIQPEDSDQPAPTKHTAAVAFFELLGLHAKGYVHLQQPEAFGDISISAKDLLLGQAA